MCNLTEKRKILNANDRTFFYLSKRVFRSTTFHHKNNPIQDGSRPQSKATALFSLRRLRKLFPQNLGLDHISQSTLYRWCLEKVEFLIV